MLTTKDLIIRESIKLFYENGLNKTSLRQIAKACRIAHPSIFNHFKNKSAIADVMFYRYLRGFVRMTLGYIEAEGLDMTQSHEAMVFYWAANYHYVKRDRRYFQFLKEHAILPKANDFLVITYFRQILRNFISIHYNRPLEVQYLYIRIITSTLLIIFQTHYEGLISLETAMTEHFRHFYTTFGIEPGVLPDDISAFLTRLDKETYLKFDLFNDVLLTDFGRPYKNSDIDNLFA